MTMGKLLEFDDFEQRQQERERQLEEPKVEKSRTFIYTVYEHDAENDKFHADVRDTDGNIIWELKKDEFPNEDELEEFDRAQEEEGATPRMRDINDLIGLRKLLLHKGLMKQEDTLRSNEQYAEDIVDRPTQVVNLNLIENKTNMKVFDFDKFLAESESISENQGTGNKFILNRFSTGAPNPAVTKFFQQHATGRPLAAKTPTGWMTVFETSLTKEALIQGFDALGITYDLYQVVHTSSGGTPNTQSASEPSASVEELKKKLKKALAADEYEEAARLRDEIAQREGRAVGAPGIGNEMGESEEIIGAAIMALENTRAFPEIHSQVKAQLHKMLSEGLNLDTI